MSGVSVTGLMTKTALCRLRDDGHYKSTAIASVTQSADTRIHGSQVVHPATDRVASEALQRPHLRRLPEGSSSRRPSRSQQRHTAPVRPTDAAHYENQMRLNGGNEFLLNPKSLLWDVQCE
jgi:hypothetical protein